MHTPSKIHLPAVFVNPKPNQEENMDPPVKTALLTTVNIDAILGLDATAPTRRIFKCPRCKSTDVRFNMKQAKSGDEASSAFLKCNLCRHRWRKG